jgi:hypothetical protein
MAKSAYKAPWEKSAGAVEDKALPELDSNEPAEGEPEADPTAEASVIHIHKPTKEIHTENVDGSQSHDTFKDVDELKSKLDKFFDSEEKEWKEDPEEEEEAHKDDFGKDDEKQSSNPFSDFGSILGKR